MQNYETTKFSLINCVTVSSYMTLEARPCRAHNIGERRNSGEDRCGLCILYLGRGTITMLTRVHANVGGAEALQGLLRSDPLLPNLARPDSTHWKLKTKYLRHKLRKSVWQETSLLK